LQYLDLTLAELATLAALGALGFDLLIDAFDPKAFRTQTLVAHR
jgi:hypothetical protein